MSYVADQIRLPPDPPKYFDIKRLSAVDLMRAGYEKDLILALMPVARIVGIADTSRVTSEVCTGGDWVRANYRDRTFWTIDWLNRECKARNQHFDGTPK